jgi:biofilm PGA synthesis N-glycosyltransferase PgaC
MRIFLTYITLYGINFTIWGVVGLSRLIAEEARNVRRGDWPIILLAPLIAIASLFVCTALLHLAVYGFAVLPAGQTLPIFELTILILFILSWTALFSAAGNYFYAYFIKIRFTVIPMVLYGSTFGFGAALYLTNQYAELTGNRLIVPVITIALSVLSARWGLMCSRKNNPPLRSSHFSGDKSPQISGDKSPQSVSLEEVAVLVPAHNEEKTIRRCLQSLKKVISMKQVFVGSDGSTDNTFRFAKRFKCNVAKIRPNGGKARVIKYLLDKYSVCEHYKAVLILDADSEIDGRYLKTALPLFDDPTVSAIAGHAIPKWRNHRHPRWDMFFISYRVRLYMLTQAVLRYGQTWKYSNVSFIVPGFASMYRCSALRNIDVTAEGLVIEDFNMTFELHHKRLGKIAYTPKVNCSCEDPHNLNDYVKQVRRWYLGFWQTVRLHGFWPGPFWLSLGAYIFEMLLQSVIFIAIPVLLAAFIWTKGGPIPMWYPSLGAVDLSISDFVLGVLVADYVLTIIVSLLDRKPILLIYGLGFVFLRWIDACLFLFTLPLTFFVKSDGKWVSPSRA